MKILSLPLANDPQHEECAVTAFANTLHIATTAATQSRKGTRSKRTLQKHNGKAKKRLTVGGGGGCSVQMKTNIARNDMSDLKYICVLCNFV